MLKSMSRRAFAGLALAAVAAFSGSAMAEQPKKTLTFGLIAKSQSNPVFIAARQGAVDEAAKLSKSMGVEIKIDWRTPVSEDAQKQADYIEQLIASGADGIAVSATDAKTLEKAINSAVEKGIPVVTFDSDVPASKRFAYFGTNDKQAGVMVAEELGKALGGKGVVAVLAGNQTAPNLQARVAGVKEGLKKFDGIKLLDVYYHKETPQDAVAKMEEIQRTNPQVTGWALVGGWPLNTKNALDNIAGKAKVVSVDALRPMLAYVENGQVETLLAQQVYEWGTMSVQLLAEKVVNNKAPKDPIVNADLIKITKSNAGEYGKNWAKWLGEDKK